jgi:hypothetical protein
VFPAFNYRSSIDLHNTEVEVVMKPINSWRDYVNPADPIVAREEVTIPTMVARIRYLEAQLSATQRAYEGLRRFVMNRPWQGPPGEANVEEPQVIRESFGFAQPRLEGDVGVQVGRSDRDVGVGTQVEMVEPAHTSRTSPMEVDVPPPAVVEPADTAMLADASTTTPLEVDVPLPPVVEEANIAMTAHSRTPPSLPLPPSAPTPSKYTPEPEHHRSIASRPPSPSRPSRPSTTPEAALATTEAPQASTSTATIDNAQRAAEVIDLDVDEVAPMDIASPEGEPEEARVVVGEEIVKPTDEVDNVTQGATQQEPGEIEG